MNLNNKLNSLIHKFETINTKWFWFVLLAIVLRLLAASIGFNYDLESWAIVGKSVSSGGTVYLDTFRYTTGPIWCYVLGGIYFIHDLLGMSETTSYHLMVTLFLSMVDVVTGYLVAKNSKPIYGLIVILNPASILISGFHTQFESFALIFAFLSWLITIKSESDSKNHLYAAILVGISLTVKHILVFYPIWLFMANKDINLKNRLYYLVIPYVVFLGSFVPFMIDEAVRQGVIEHVFRYQSAIGTSLMGMVLSLLPDFIMKDLLGWIPVFSGMKFFFLITMLYTGFVVSRNRYKQLFPFYLVSMIVFTPSFADQYLVIPVIAMAMYIKHFEMKMYLAAISVYLMFITPNNIGPYFVPKILKIGTSLISTADSGTDLKNEFEEVPGVLNAGVGNFTDSISTVKSQYTGSEKIVKIKEIVKSLLFLIYPLTQIWLVVFYIRFVVGRNKLFE